MNGRKSPAWSFEIQVKRADAPELLEFNSGAGVESPGSPSRPRK